MDSQLPYFFQRAASNSPMSESNDSGPDGPMGPLPAGVMDSLLATAGRISPLMQLILFVYRMLGAHLGLDPSLVLTLLGIFWGVSKVAGQVYVQVGDFIDRHFVCAMYVSEHDQIHSHLMNWLSRQQSISKSQYLMAQTVWKSAWEEEDDLESTLFFTDGGDADSGRQYLNFSNQAARSSPRFVPAMGKTWFWYNGNLIRVYRKKESIVATSGWGGIKDQEEIKISCMGRSTEPLKRLLASAKELYYNDNRQKTSIYRPEFRDRGFNHVMWKQLVRRPVRPMRTVMLAKQDKHTVLEDMNEFLHPSAPAWYAIRGIPLRRGYLFHGPPGTGKTSFSFALAGTFGLDMYVINLQDVNVTDASLLELFTKLPRRCVFLLEDIDTAGLRRDEGSGDDDDDGDEEEEEEAGSDKNEASQMRNKQAVTKAGGKTETHNLKETRNKNQGTDNGVHVDKNKHGSERQRRNTPKGAARNQTKKVGGKSPSSENLSLAGLLNAIDGVATHEGRVLIMTTNKPESLDKALIRPGRMDIQVKFKNASSQQARELFCRMYEADAPPRPTKQVSENAKASKDEKQGGTSEMMTARCRGPELAPEELKRMAAEFGDKIPEGLFSPADIQGFLLYRMADPQKALDDAESWIEGFIKQKESGSKVRTVQ